MADDPELPVAKRVRNLAELAELAGVSPGTVSRALSGAGLISPKTRARIQALARAHNFTPNVIARNLRIQRTGAIAVVIPLGHETGRHLSDPFFMSMLGYLADGLTERGYDLLLSRVIPKDDNWLDRIVDSGRVDGIIVIGQSDQLETLERVAARYRPLVVWGGFEEGQMHCSVGSDNRLGGLLATRHLIERGCRRIAFFGDPRAREVGQRLDGCRKAMAEVGLSAAVMLVPVKLVAEDAAPDIARFLAGNSELPEGIVAASDVVALSLIQALTERRIAVPETVRIVGYDDLAIAQQTVPRLSSVRQNIADGAGHLVDLLLRRIAGEATEAIMMPPELIVRQSS